MSGLLLPSSDMEAKEKAYLFGLRTGDLNGRRDSRHTIHARLSTTHPAMAGLFIESFNVYGRCSMSPDLAYLPGRYCWKLLARLDERFSFFVEKPVQIPVASSSFFPFFAGYSDSEGSWCIYNDKGRAAVAFVIESKDRVVLIQSALELKNSGFHPLLYRASRDGQSDSPKVRLEVRRRDEVRTLARILIALSRHREKIAKMKLVLETEESSWADIDPKSKAFKQSVAAEVASFVGAAEIQYNIRHSRAVAGVVG